jgi:hypothetical protein
MRNLLGRYRLEWNVALLLVATLGAARAAQPGEQLLRYVYGDPAVAIDASCWPHEDLWMLKGERNDAALAELSQEKITHGPNEVFWLRVQHALCVVEVRDGKADPRFLLDQVYLRHRQVLLQFVYAALTQDQEMLSKLATRPAHVKFGNAKPPAMGDLDVYQELIAHLPVLRISAPAADKSSRRVTYRVPLGKAGLDLRLVKKGGSWLVDTDKVVDVPLEFFFM